MQSQASSMAEDLLCGSWRCDWDERSEADGTGFGGVGREQEPRNAGGSRGYGGKRFFCGASDKTALLTCQLQPAQLMLEL